MPQVDPDFQARLDSGATTHCRCWRIRRKDGVALGFTDHDRALQFEGLEFRPDSGLDASALQTATGLSVDNGQAVGALSDAAISEDDLRSGRYDGAEVDHWLVDWTASTRRVHLFRGSIGEIRRTETSFEAELRGLAEALNVPVGRTIKRTCDRIVGDKKCGVDLMDPRYRLEGAVLEATEAGRLTATAGSHPEGWFTGGVLRWLTGRNKKLTAVVRQDRLAGGERKLHLATEATFMPEPGDRFVLTAGCDRRMSTCRDKFDNLLNFRGFPHIPGNDWILAYPKGGEVHDGSSLARP